VCLLSCGVLCVACGVLVVSERNFIVPHVINSADKRRGKMMSPRNDGGLMRVSGVTVW